jgi:phage FluMu protein Com
MEFMASAFYLEVLNMKCRRFKAEDPSLIENCPNCKRWNGTRCKDEVCLSTDYDDSEEFKEYEQMMLKNKGVRGPL